MPNPTSREEAPWFIHEMPNGLGYSIGCDDHRTKDGEHIAIAVGLTLERANEIVHDHNSHAADKARIAALEEALQEIAQVCNGRGIPNITWIKEHAQTALAGGAS